MLRSLLFLILLAAPLYAQVPSQLPLPPRPTTDNSQLKGLGDFFSGTRVTHPQVDPVEPPGQAIQIPDRLPPPNPLRQASFTSHPISAPTSTLPEEFPDDRRIEEPFYENEDEYPDVYNPMLDKQLRSSKRAQENNDFNDFEDDELSTGGWANKLSKPELTPFMSVGGSLLIVIAAFLLLAILFRKVAPQGNRPLPKEAFECLGRYYLTQKHQLQVLRLGSRIVLVSVMPDGVSTLAEITDPDEAVSFLGLCRRLDTNSATELYRKTIANMSEEELSRPHGRPVVTSRRKTQPSGSLDLYSDPDESIAEMLARGRRNGR